MGRAIIPHTKSIRAMARRSSALAPIDAYDRFVDCAIGSMSPSEIALMELEFVERGRLRSITVRFGRAASQTAVVGARLGPDL